MKNKIKKITQFVSCKIMSIVCLFNGHESENYLKEDRMMITTKRCKRCHSVLIGNFSTWIWKIKKIPPPNSTPRQIKSWEKYCENKWQDLRDSCVK